MATTKTWLTILVIALSAGLISACAKDEPPPAPQPTTAPAPQPTAPVVSEPMEPQGPIPGSLADLMDIAGGDRVYFAFDSAELSGEARDTLRKQADWLKNYGNVRVTVEGHCDERGTREYNLALGERRANAVRSYLIALGVDGSRLSTISYGKERPAVLGSNESAWAKNRRGVLNLSGAAGS